MTVFPLPYLCADATPLNNNKALPTMGGGR